MHNKNLPKYRVYQIIGWNPRVKSISCSSIDYYLTKYKSLRKEKTFELYCHPNYKEGVFLDDSPSYLKHERQPMLNQIQMLKEIRDIEFVSWENVF